MTDLTHQPRRISHLQSHVPPGELPTKPDDIDLDRIVTDPEYRRAVQDLLRRWGVCDDKPKRTPSKRSRVASLR